MSRSPSPPPRAPSSTPPATALSSRGPSSCSSDRARATRPAARDLHDHRHGGRTRSSIHTGPRALDRPDDRGRRGVRRSADPSSRAHPRPGHGRITQAVLHATARGIVTASINGTPVSDDVLTPGWSSYEWRLRTAATTSPACSETRVPIASSSGWSWVTGGSGAAGLDRGTQIYGPELGAFAQLEIDFADGHRQTFITDESWRAGPSAVIANDLYDGQTIDARRHDTAWQSPGFVGEGWVGVHALHFDAGDPDCVRRTAGPPAAGRRGTTGLAIAHGTHPGRLRAEPRRLGAVRRCRRPWSRPSRSATPRCSRAGSWDAALRTAQATDRLILSGGHGPVRAHPDRSTGSDTPRSTAGPAISPLHRSPRSSCTPSSGGSAISAAPTTC